jgi:hypothetical protein
MSETVTSIPERGCIMRNHDFVSDGFLAVTAASAPLIVRMHPNVRLDLPLFGEPY